MMQDDRIIVAFSPCNEDYATKGHMWSIYNPSLDKPYDIENGKEKLQRAVEELDPDSYELQEGEYWINIDYQSIINGTPTRIRYDKDN